MGTAIVIGITAVPVVLALQLLWNQWQTGWFFSIRMPRPYRDRQSQEAAWKSRYPDAFHPEVDCILTLICETFLVLPNNRLQFAPDDRLLDIYRACYPRRWSWLRGDCMEIESIMTALDIDATDLHPGTTLGDLVDLLVRKGTTGVGPQR